jgi:hypothetical protein
MRYRNIYGYGSIPIDTFLVGWTSIYQLFWGSLGTRVLTHPHIPILYISISHSILGFSQWISTIFQGHCLQGTRHQSALFGTLGGPGPGVMGFSSQWESTIYGMHIGYIYIIIYCRYDMYIYIYIYRYNI